MVSYGFETTTIIAVTAIGVILTLYIIVLKRKGWLKGTANEDFYRCPNQECRKIFEKPIQVTDLLETSKPAYNACPYCGLNLEELSSIKSEKKPLIDIKIPFISKKSKEIYEDTFLSDPAVRTEGDQKNVLISNETQNLRQPSRRQIEKEPVITFKKDLQAPILEKPEELTLKIREEIVTKEKPLGCAHYFGFLKTIANYSEIPDACYRCKKMMDCYS